MLAGIILVAGAKDSAAIQVKLDQLIRAVDQADHRLVGIDQRSVEELERVRTIVDAQTKLPADTESSGTRPVAR